MIERKWDGGYRTSARDIRLSFRVRRLLFAVVTLRSAFVLGLLRLGLLAGSLALLARPLLAFALLLGPLPVAVVPLTVVRFVPATSVAVLVLRLLGIL